jgi:hypothetical protein
LLACNAAASKLQAHWEGCSKRWTAVRLWVLHNVKKNTFHHSGLVWNPLEHIMKFLLTTDLYEFIQSAQILTVLTRDPANSRGKALSPHAIHIFIHRFCE